MKSGWNRSERFVLGFLFLAALTAGQAYGGEGGSVWNVEETVEVDTIWSAVSVGFCLLTHGEMQYVAYYDSERNMAVAQRKLSDDKFQKTVLPSRQTWDSHNYITMAVDEEGHIHLAGNMHADALIYFRTEVAGDISTLKQVKSMVGRNEKRCTYPKFMKGPGGSPDGRPDGRPDRRLLFHYRDGGSGNGVEIYNVYDTKTKAWKRLLDKPLIGVKGMNAYQMGPRLGPDGLYHLAWVWRNTPDCATNHDISYARSRDLKNWETAGGKALELPIGPDDKETVVDPVPVGGGLINMGNGMGFDSQKRPLVTYHRYDKDGNNQAYIARFQEGIWQIHQITEWKHRWAFSGGGSISCKVAAGSPQLRPEGKLAVPYRHEKYGSGLLILDEKTLKLEGTEKRKPRYPKELTKPVSKFPGMQVKWRGDSGSSKHRYALRWETLPPNRDRPRKGKLPENGKLVLVRIGKGTAR